MIHIKISDTYLAANPRLGSLGQSFLLSIGDDDYPIPSVSRDISSVPAAVASGSPLQILLRPGSDFQIDNEVFQTLVKSAEAGGDTQLVNRLLYFINRGMVEVHQDGGPPLTAAEVLVYTAP